MKKEKKLETFKNLAKWQELSDQGKAVIKGGTILIADIASI